jgi:hypothetical protein
MSNLISGLLPVVLVVAFLGYYAISINSAPLWVIIGAILAMVVTDFVQSVWKGNHQPGD